MTKVKVSAPWVTYYHQLQALFGQDPEINVAFDNDTRQITLYVNNTNKAEALERLLPAEKQYGNVVQKITIVPANMDKENYMKLFKQKMN